MGKGKNDVIAPDVIATTPASALSGIATIAEGPDLALPLSPARPVITPFGPDDFAKLYGEDKCHAKLVDENQVAYAYVGDSTVFMIIDSRFRWLNPDFDQSRGAWSDTRVTMSTQDPQHLTRSRTTFFDGAAIVHNEGLFSRRKIVELSWTKDDIVDRARPEFIWSKKLIYENNCPQKIRNHLLLSFLDRILYGTFSR